MSSSISCMRAKSSWLCTLVVERSIATFSSRVGQCTDSNLAGPRSAMVSHTKQKTRVAHIFHLLSSSQITRISLVSCGHVNPRICGFRSVSSIAVRPFTKQHAIQVSARSMRLALQLDVTLRCTMKIQPAMHIYFLVSGGLLFLCLQ